MGGAEFCPLARPVGTGTTELWLSSRYGDHDWERIRAKAVATVRAASQAPGVLPGSWSSARAGGRWFQASYWGFPSFQPQQPPAGVRPKNEPTLCTRINEPSPTTSEESPPLYLTWS